MESTFIVKVIFLENCKGEMELKIFVNIDMKPFFTVLKNNELVMFNFAIKTGCPKKKFLCLIWCKLKTSVFTRPIFTLSESSYFNLKFSQSKIG